MKKYRSQKAGYTIEAAIYIPIILCLLFQTLGIAIEFWQNSRSREVYRGLQNINAVKEFYTYQILDEIGEEIKDD